MGDFDDMFSDPDLGGEQVVLRQAGQADTQVWVLVRRAKPIAFDIGSTKAGHSKTQVHSVVVKVSPYDCPVPVENGTKFIMFRQRGDSETSIMTVGAILRQTPEYFELGLI